MFRIRTCYFDQDIEKSQDYFDYITYQYNIINDNLVFTNTCGEHKDVRTLIPSLKVARKIIKLFIYYINLPNSALRKRKFKIEYV